MKHVDKNKQNTKKGKIIATVGGITGLAVTATGVYAAITYQDKQVEKDPNVPTTVSDTDNKTIDDLMVLTKGFDINDPVQVKERANAIYKLCEDYAYVKDFGYVTEEDIINLIYILGGKYDSITYPSTAKTDAEKHDYLRYLALAYGEVIDEGVVTTGFAVTQRSVASSYQFISAEETDAKNICEEITRLYYKQKENLINNDEVALRNTAEEYYNLFVSVSQMDLSPAEIVLIYEQFSAYNESFTEHLAEEKAQALDNALGKSAASKDIVWQYAAKKLDISEKLDKGECGENTTPRGEKYDANDAQNANNHPAAGNGSSAGKKEEVQSGGEKPNNSTGKQEQINVPTTSVEKETFFAPVTEDNIKVTNPDGDSFVVDITGSGQYVVEEEGNELVSEVAVENTRSIMKEKFVYSDAEAAELADKAYYKDLYSGIRK